MRKIATPRKRPSFTYKELLKSILRSSDRSQKRFTERCSSELDVEHAWTVSSGRIAQYIALKAADIGEGDRVIVPALTYPVVPLVVRRAGAEVVFVDVGDDFNIDTEDLEEVMDNDIDAIITTHLYGNPSDMDRIQRLAGSHDALVLEDYSHAFGSFYKDVPVGSIGEVNFASMSVSKEPTLIRGGIITTDNDRIAERIDEIIESHEWSKRALLSLISDTLVNKISTTPSVFSLVVYPFIRNEWTREKLEHAVDEQLPEDPELDFLSTRPFQAELGLIQLEKLDNIRDRKDMLVSAYNRNLADDMEKPSFKDGAKPLSYVLKSSERDHLISRLREKGVDCEKGNMRDCSQLRYFEGGRECPKAHEIDERKFHLPLDRLLSETTAEDIGGALKKVIRDGN